MRMMNIEVAQDLVSASLPGNLVVGLLRKSA